MTIPVDTMLAYRTSGLSVLPARLAEKRPMVHGGWKAYQAKPAGEPVVRAWFTADHDACCIVCGAVSGNLEMLDFDFGGELFDAWFENVEAKAPGLIERLVVETSPSGGWHVAYRCEDPVSGNLKLAQRDIVCPNADPIAVAGKSFTPRRRPDGSHSVVITLIETRGEGGLFLCAPTVGYELAQGDFTSLPVLTADEREILLNAAWSLDETSPVVVNGPQNVNGSGTSPSGLRPGDDYNDRGDLREALQQHGWSLFKGKGPDGNEQWTRPDKRAGCSATFNGEAFYVFSSNAAPFEPDTAYSKFAAYTMLAHAGDFAAATRALAGEGFGESLEQDNSDVDISAIMASVSARDVDDDEDDDDPSADDVPDPGPLPERLLHVPGFINEVVEYSLSNMPVRNHAMAFTGALALQSFLGGRKVRDSSDNRTNAYFIALAPSGAGKDFARKVNAAVMLHIGAQKSLVLRFGSGEGLEDKLARQPCILAQTDEFDGMLQTIKHSKDHRHEVLMDKLKEVFTSADQVMPTRVLAGKEEAYVVQPSLTIFASAIPVHYYNALSEKMLTDGFFSRTLAIESDAEPEDQDTGIVALPDRIRETAEWWAKFEPTGGNLGQQYPVPAVVDTTAGAAALIREVRVHARDIQNQANRRNDVVTAAIWSRVRQMVHKLGLIYAISANHEDPLIDEAAVEWARDFMYYHAQRMLFMAANHVTEHEFDGQCKKAIRILREWHKQNGGDGILVPWMFRRRLNMRPQDFRDVIQELTQRNAIEHVSIPGKTKPKQGFRLLNAGGKS